MTEIETLNMKTVTLDRVVKQIKMQLNSEDYSPVIVIGKSGIGKTESIAALAKELKIGFKELRLSHYQESDLVGLPYIENGKTKHAETDILPDTNDKGKGILLLDEITSSQKSMRSAVYQLMDSSRKLGNYILPPNWLIVGCGNGPDDGGDFRGIEQALMSRGRCMRVEEDLSTWKVWAVKNYIHPTVVAFLSFMPDKLHVMDMEKPNDMIACPRNWVKLSTQLINMEKMSGGRTITDEDDLEFATSVCVGETVAPYFVSFYKYTKKTLEPDDILDGKVDASAIQGMERETVYITIQSLVSCVKKRFDLGIKGTNSVDKLQLAVNVSKWLIDVGNKVQLDMAIMGFTELGHNIQEFMDIVITNEKFDEMCPEFEQFSSENGVIFD